MLVIYKVDKEGTEFELKGEGVTTNEVVFMLQSGIKLLQRAGAEDDKIKVAVEEIINNKEEN
jgi:hypothetical protein